MVKPPRCKPGTQCWYLQGTSCAALQRLPPVTGPAAHCDTTTQSTWTYCCWQEAAVCTHPNTHTWWLWIVFCKTHHSRHSLDKIEASLLGPGWTRDVQCNSLRHHSSNRYETQPTASISMLPPLQGHCLRQHHKVTSIQNALPSRHSPPRCTH